MKFRVSTPRDTLLIPRGADMREFHVSAWSTPWYDSEVAAWAAFTHDQTFKLARFLQSDGFTHPGPFDTEDIRVDAVYGPNRVAYDAASGNLERDFVIVIGQREKIGDTYVTREVDHTVLQEVAFEAWDPQSNPVDNLEEPPVGADPADPVDPEVPPEYIVPVQPSAPIEEEVPDVITELKPFNPLDWFEQRTSQEKKWIYGGGILLLLLILK